MISKSDYLWFVDAALDGMEEIVVELGDDLANRRPEVPNANSAYAILTHCLGVMEYWAGQLVAGREIERDREAEFVARGRTADLVARSKLVRAQFLRDLDSAEPDALPRGALPPGWEQDRSPFYERQGAALLHVYEELAQHRGQMEVCRDVLLAESGG